MEGRNLYFVFLFLTLTYIQLAVAQAPLTDKRTDALKKKCNEFGDKNAYTNLMKAENEFKECTKKFYTNDTEFRKDMSDLTQNGKQGAIVSKYCKRYPQLKECLENGMVYLRHCLSNQDVGSIDYLRKLFEATATFSCQSDGKELTTFITDGRDCVHEKIPGLFFCAYDRLKNYAAPIGVLPEDGYSLIKLGQLKCGEEVDFKKCVVDELKQCSKPTAAKFIQSVFDSHKKVTCNDKLKGN